MEKHCYGLFGSLPKGSPKLGCSVDSPSPASIPTIAPDQAPNPPHYWPIQKKLQPGHGVSSNGARKRPWPMRRGSGGRRGVGAARGPGATKRCGGW